MNTENENKKESGQILVIFALALVALLGLTALAIDGGMIYADRRFTQSASDAASLAGAGAAAHYIENNGVNWTNFNCSSITVDSAMAQAFNIAQSRAGSNHFIGLDDDVSDRHGILVTCTDQRQQFRRYIDVETQITSDVGTTFAHLFYPGEIKNSVTSTARVYPRTVLAYGFAIASLSHQCGTNTGGVYFDGNSDVYINGGGVFSNSCIEANGNVRVGINDGGINYYTTLTTNGRPVLQPDPQQVPARMPVKPITPPTCPAGSYVNQSGSGTIGPGNYSQIRLTNGTLTMQPGLYCVKGDFTANGGTILADGVTIYMQKDGTKNTAMSIAGNVTAHFNAPSSINVTAGAKVGLLIMMEEGNNGTISLQGTSGSSFTGAVYAPTGTVAVGGTSGINPTYNTQLVGKYVKVHGNAQIEINFRHFEPVSDAPTLDLVN